MGKILPFPQRQPSRFGFERARKRRKANSDQLDLFSPGMGKLLRLPKNISLFEKALLLDERNDRKAGEAYLKAITEGDQVADAYCNLGILESRDGRNTKAFDCFTKALEIDPKHFESHYNLGNLYFEGDDLRLAKMHYELAAEINPSFPDLYFNLGLVLALLKETKAAIDVLLKYQLLASPKERRNAEDLINNLRRSLAARG